MMIGASFLRAASRHALIPDDDTQFTAGIAYPAHTQHDQEKNGPLMTSEEEREESVVRVIDTTLPQTWGR